MQISKKQSMKTAIKDLLRVHLDDSDIFAYESRLCVASEINDGIDEVARYEDIIEEAKDSGVIEGLDKIEPQI